jgi:hypothetical protein
MRDPRYEPAQMEMGACVAESSATGKVRIRAISHMKADVTLDVTRMDAQFEPMTKGAWDARHIEQKNADLSVPVELALPPLPAGGYSALLKIGDGVATRRDFACEVGGDEWADSRPDPKRLRAMADATKGSFQLAKDAASLTLPKAVVVSTERHVAPIAPPWLWAVLAALSVGAHWYARRRSGLS